MSSERKYSCVDFFIGAAPKASIFALSSPSPSLILLRIRKFAREYPKGAAV